MTECERAVSLSAMDKLLKGGAASEEPDDDGFKLPDEEETRPGDGWEKDVPSVQKISQMTDDERDAHREKRMRNVRKQMVIAQRRLRKVQEMERAELLRTKRAGGSRKLKRHISYGDIVTAKLRNEKLPWRPTADRSAQDMRREAEKEQAMEAERRLKFAGEDERKRQLLIAKRREKKKALEKAKLPSHYKDPQQYTPPKKQYSPRRRSYAHEHVVMSETPGPGSYKLKKLGEDIKGQRENPGKGNLAEEAEVCSSHPLA